MTSAFVGKFGPKRASTKQHNQFVRSRQSTHLSFQADNRNSSMMGSKLLDLSDLEIFDQESAGKALRNIESRIARKTYKMNLNQ